MFKGDRLGIRRRIGVLDEQGNLRSDEETLRREGVKKRWWHKFVPGHRSHFVMRKDLFWKLGGYDESEDGKPRKRKKDGSLRHWPGGAGQKFWRTWQSAEERGEVEDSVEKLLVFMLPDKRWCN